MPRQNRVTPFGEIIACPDRGTFMGNRGVLHDEHRRIRRSWQVRRWLILAWSPGGYRERLPRPRGIEVATLTPRSTVHAILSGYEPEIHATARE